MDDSRVLYDAGEPTESLLLDPAAWEPSLAGYARAVHLATALADDRGRLVGPCLNPQPLWSAFRSVTPEPGDACPFCAMPSGRCHAIDEALRTGVAVHAEDRIGLVHVALPLVLGGRVVGVLLAGQAMLRYPDYQLLAQAAARVGLPAADAWAAASVHRPIGRRTFDAFVDLLDTLGTHLLRSRSELLERQRAEELLRAAQRARDDFLAMLAHELRNPLAPLSSALAILTMPNATPETTARAREMMARQVRAMARMIDDLLDAARVARGKVQLSRERVDLGEIVRRAVEAARVTHPSRQIALHATAEPLPLVADAVRIEQVVTNLVNNAVKATNAGGHIAVDAAREASAGVVRVRDDGIGMAPELLPRVFDLFAQADQSLARTRGGLGIGLTVVKHLVELHGGTVEARSGGVGRGSEFEVRLPLVAPPSEAEPAPAASAAPAPQAARRVIVVDDNADAADGLALILRLEGHEARTAYDGASALAELRSFAPDVAFLDIGLPGMDGYELAARMREACADRRLLLVAMTGYGQERDRHRSLDAGFDEHLVKPVGRDELERVMEHA